MANGFPTLLSAQIMQGHYTRTKSQLSEANKELSTERTADIGKRMNGDIGRVQKLEQRFNDLETRQAGRATLGIRANSTQDALNGLREHTTAYSSNAISIRGGSSDGVIEAQAAAGRNGLEFAVSTLNSSAGGEYLFGGAATDRPPLDSADAIEAAVQAIVTAAPDAATALANIDAYFTGGAFDAAHYNGVATPAPTVDVAEGRRLGVDVKATDAGLKRMVQGFAISAVADDPALPQEFAEELLEGANALLNQAASEVTAIQAEVGVVQAEIDRLDFRAEAEKITLQTAIDDLIGVDEYEVATRITVLETQLQTNYTLTARIANLSLANYL